MARVLTPDEIDEADGKTGGPARAGGKAAHLAALTRDGFRVPAWFALDTAVLRDLRDRVQGEIDAALKDLAPSGRRGDRWSDRAAVEAASARIRAAVRAAGLRQADEDELVLRCDATFAHGARLAVRSSAVGEDSAEASFAGQLDSRLHVQPDEVVDAALDVLASAWSPRALLYRRLRELEAQPVEAGVVVQEMVDPRAAGVLFTVDPANGDPSAVVLSAGLGLGEGVVADLVETDTWFLDKASGAVRREAVRLKTHRVVFDAERGRGTRLEPVPAAEQAAPALSEEERTQLLEVARRLEERRGGPQDVEWAIDREGTLHLLQTRPVTAVAKDAPRGRERIFDNSNVVEGYPGVTTPLTYSFVRAGYEVIFRRSAEAFGVPAETVRANRAVFAHMVAFLDGRIYYDLLNWYRLYGMVPGFEERVRAWEAALGLPPRAEATAVSRTLGESLAQLPQRGRTAWRIARNFVRLDADVARFKQRFAHVRDQFVRCDPDGRDAEGLVELYEFLLDELLGHWEITTVVDFYAFQLHALLGSLLTRWGVQGEGDLRNDLLCGEQGMESVEPVRSLFALAEAARADEALLALLARERDDRRALTAILTKPAHEAFRDRFARHVASFGDRTLHELELETPTLAEAPHLLVRQLRSVLSSERRIEDLEAREREVRAAAEARVSAALGPLRGAALRYVLRRTRAAVRHREDLRLARSRAFGLVKQLFRRLGVLLAEAGLLADAEDVFFLTVDEVVGAVRGSAVTRDLGALVRLRRAEHRRNLIGELPARVQVRGIAYARPFPLARRVGTSRALTGLGCAPGVVRARARVVRDPAAEAPIAGEVLIARQTDPGWVFLMVTAGGLVVERGSLLSHTAIIGRELGIPTVVGVAGATDAIRTGDLVELDGAAGTVRVLDEEAAQGAASEAEPPRESTLGATTGQAAPRAKEAKA